MTSPQAPPPVQGSAGPVAAPGAPAAPSSTSGTANMSQSIGSMSDLKMKNPALYNMMMQGIAVQIIDQMQADEGVLDQMIKQEEEDDNRE